MSEKRTLDDRWVFHVEEEEDDLQKATQLAMFSRPPGSGWEPIPKGKHGGFRRRKGKDWEYWYPGEAPPKPAKKEFEWPDKLYEMDTWTWEKMEGIGGLPVYWNGDLAWAADAKDMIKAWEIMDEESAPLSAAEKRAMDAYRSLPPNTPEHVAAVDEYMRISEERRQYRIYMMAITDALSGRPYTNAKGQLDLSTEFKREAYKADTERNLYEFRRSQKLYEKRKANPTKTLMVLTSSPILPKVAVWKVSSTPYRGEPERNNSTARTWKEGDPHRQFSDAEIYESFDAMSTTMNVNYLDAVSDDVLDVDYAVNNAVTLFTNGHVQTCRNPHLFSESLTKEVNGPGEWKLTPGKKDYESANRILKSLASRKNPTSRPVYRGILLPSSLADQLKVGQTFDTRDVSSWSVNVHTADNFAKKKQKPGHRPVRFQMVTDRGVYLDQYSAYGGEFEYVFGGDVLIKSIETTFTGGLVVHVEPVENRNE